MLRILIVLSLEVLILIGCSRKSEIDGSNPREFSASVTAISRNLSTDRRIEFMNDLKTINNKYGSYSSTINNPSTSFLSFVNGKNAFTVHKEAEGIRLLDARNHILRLYSKLSKLNKKIEEKNNEYKHRHTKEIEAISQLKNININDISVTKVTSDPISGVESSIIKFHAKNNTPYLASIANAELTGNFGKTKKTYHLHRCFTDFIVPDLGRIMPNSERTFKCKIYGYNLEKFKDMNISITGGIFNGIRVNDLNPSLFTYKGDSRHQTPTIKERRDQIITSIHNECLSHPSLKIVCLSTDHAGGG